MNNVIQQATNTSVGIIAYSKMRHDLGSSVGFINDWEARDIESRAHGKYEHRFSFSGLIHGKWYCYAKLNILFSYQKNQLCLFIKIKLGS